jgi:hypothetical protein
MAHRAQQTGTVRHRAHGDWARCAIVPNPAYSCSALSLTAEAADCPELAALIRQGWEIAGFEAGAIPECLERARRIEDLPPGAFDDLDRTYYRLEESTDLDAVMRRWLDQR